MDGLLKAAERIESDDREYWFSVDHLPDAAHDARLLGRAYRDLLGLLRRCRPSVAFDVQMASDLSRFAPLRADEQWKHDTTETESEKLLPLIDTAIDAAGDAQ